MAIIQNILEITNANVDIEIVIRLKILNVICEIVANFSTITFFFLGI